MLEGVEVHGGRGGGVWEGWRCVGRVEEFGGRVKVCGGRGGVWEG